MDEGQVIGKKETVKNTFQDDADDSSDEESVIRNITSYNLENKWAEYTDSRKTNPERDDTTKLAFTTHMYGLKLLYSPGTNAIYYPLKKSSLGNNQFSNEVMWLNFAFQNVFDEIKKRFNNYLFNVTFTEYQRLYQPQLDYDILQLKSHMRPLLLWLNGKPSTVEIDRIFQNIFEHFYLFFCFYGSRDARNIMQHFVTREVCLPSIKETIDLIKGQFFTIGLNQLNLDIYYKHVNLNSRKVLGEYAVKQTLSYLSDLRALKDNNKPLDKNEREKLVFTLNSKFPKLGLTTEKW